MRRIAIAVCLLAGSAVAKPPASDLPVRVFRSQAAAHALGLREPRRFDYRHWMLVWVDDHRSTLGEVADPPSFTTSASQLVIQIVASVSRGGNCPAPCCGGDGDGDRPDHLDHFLDRDVRARGHGALTGTLYRLPRSPLTVVVKLVHIVVPDDCKAP